VTPDCCHAHRRQASAFSTHRPPPQLARCHFRCQVRRKALRRLREDALIRRLRGLLKSAQHRLIRVHLRVTPQHLTHLLHCRRAVCRLKTLLGDLSVLRRIHTEPDPLHLRPRRPVRAELFQISRPPRNLSGDRAVHSDLLPNDVFLDPRIRRRSAPPVMLRLQPVDRHHQLKIAALCPVGRNRPHRACHHLRPHASRFQPLENLAHLAVPYQRLASDNRYVQRLQLVHHLGGSPHQFVASVVTQLPQQGSVSQVLRGVCITPRTSQRTLLGDLQRQERPVSCKNPSPRGQHVS